MDLPLKVKVKNDYLKQKQNGLIPSKSVKTRYVKRYMLITSSDHISFEFCTVLLVS